MLPLRLVCLSFHTIMPFFHVVQRCNRGTYDCSSMVSQEYIPGSIDALCGRRTITGKDSHSLLPEATPTALLLMEKPAHQNGRLKMA